jgi:hypothetical protein
MVRGFFILALVMSLAAASHAQRPTDARRVRVAELANRAADLIDRKRFAAAEQVLNDALAIEPDDLTSLYDRVCAIAGEDDPARALKALEQANRAGFGDFLRADREPVLRAMRGLPRFRREFDPPDAAIHRAAQFHIHQLQAMLGEEYTVAADEPHRLIYAVRERSANLEEVRKSTVALMSRECDLLFHNRPQQFVRIIVASQVDYARLETRSEVQGSYDDATRTVLAKETGPELRHELTHALHAADQHARGQQHPVWLVEGLGVAFENGDETADNWRLANVQAAVRSKSAIPLSALLTMSQAAFQQRSDLAYGEAGSLIVYLHDKQQLVQFYDAFAHAKAADQTGRRALEVVSGQSLDELERDWRSWVMDKVVPPRIKR